MSATTASEPISTGMLRPEPAPGIKFKLSIMMFLQYAIWGAWLPLMFPYFTEFRGLTAQQISVIAAIGAAGALVAPFIAGQIADRYFNAERLLGVFHITGGVLMYAPYRAADFSASTPCCSATWSSTCRRWRWSTP